MKYLITLLLCLASANAKAFDAVAIDKAVSDFIDKRFGDECDDISHSFKHMMYVGEAYERGRYTVHPSKMRLLMTDVEVVFSMNACGREEGYSAAFREGEDGVKVIQYVSLDHPPEPD